MMTFTERTTVMTRTIWAAVIGVLLASTPARAQGVVVYYHTDAIGSVRATTDELGVVIDRYDFLPFGEAWLPPTTPDKRQFAGKERDAETGLDYFGARYHMSGIGRFTTVDPVMNVEAALTDPQRWNRYAYVRNNPFVFIDPDGRDITTPASFQQRAFTQQVGANLQALGKSAINIVRSINSPGHMMPDAEARYFEQPDSPAEASRMQFFNVVMAAASASLGMRAQAGALGSVRSIDDVLAAPSVLRGGMTPERLMSQLGSLPQAWRVEVLGKGGSKGQGFLLREYHLGSERMEPTGRMIRWHPGGGHHGEGPYWRVIGHNSKSEVLR